MDVPTVVLSAWRGPARSRPGKHLVHQGLPRGEGLRPAAALEPRLPAEPGTRPSPARCYPPTYRPTCLQPQEARRTPACSLASMTAGVPLPRVCSLVKVRLGCCLDVPFN